VRQQEHGAKDQHPDGTVASRLARYFKPSVMMLYGDRSPTNNANGSATRSDLAPTDDLSQHDPDGSNTSF
jgi:hypothetical protein